MNPYLRRVGKEDSLRLFPGIYVRDYYHLLKEIKYMTAKEFKQYLANHPKEIENWVKNVFTDIYLHKKITKAKTRVQYISALTTRINYLENKFEGTWPNKRDIPYLFAGIILLLAFVLVIAFYYAPKINLQEQTIARISSDSKETIGTILGYEQKLQKSEYEIEKLKQELNRKEETIILPIEDEIPAPKNRINREDIELTNNSLTIHKTDLYVAEIANTGSMLPLFDSHSEIIQIVPKSEKEISPGDIISFTNENKIYIHRVKEIGYDSAGWYAITKGDNVLGQDPLKIRFGSVKKILVGILY
ncbi:hypothetical protein K9L67_00225 [Candidatus Woesearchaeota archaeon]|nr:hypothetical protein [Candidatus Woesearchaeota archaeon]MCF7900632.1 hypothetical protein [Candidatus Woesearchaeota archaeon]MCF8013472.1 hypothetical protein [Candidatus Woesearchaeota archaeon]